MRPSTPMNRVMSIPFSTAARSSSISRRCLRRVTVSAPIRLSVFSSLTLMVAHCNPYVSKMIWRASSGE